MIALFWLAGCVVDANTSGGAFVCEDVAITDASGNPDPCDVAACQACVDECGRDCAVLESYPPRYACDRGASWTVDDFCDDWQPPGTTPRVTDIEDLGCGEGDDPAESISATGTAGHIAVTHENYALGCCPESVEVGLAVSGSTITVSPTPVNDLCQCACMLDARYAIADVPSGTWTITHAATGASTSVIVP